MFRRAVVVTQLVERSLLTPEICGSNPVIGKFYLLSILLKDLLKRRKQRKEAGNGPIQKNKTNISMHELHHSFGILPS